MFTTSHLLSPFSPWHKLNQNCRIGCLSALVLAWFVPHVLAACAVEQKPNFWASSKRNVAQILLWCNNCFSFSVLSCCVFPFTDFETGEKVVRALGERGASPGSADLGQITVGDDVWSEAAHGGSNVTKKKNQARDLYMIRCVCVCVWLRMWVSVCVCVFWDFKAGTGRCSENNSHCVFVLVSFCTASAFTQTRTNMHPVPCSSYRPQILSSSRKHWM